MLQLLCVFGLHFAKHSISRHFGRILEVCAMFPFDTPDHQGDADNGRCASGESKVLGQVASRHPGSGGTTQTRVQTYTPRERSARDHRVMYQCLPGTEGKCLQATSKEPDNLGPLQTVVQQTYAEEDIGRILNSFGTYDLWYRLLCQLLNRLVRPYLREWKASDVLLCVGQTRRMCGRGHGHETLR